MDHVADARARGQRREEALNLILTCDDRLAQVERDQRRERRRLSRIRARLHLLGESRAGQLPQRRVLSCLGQRKHAQVRPKLAESAQNGRLGDFLADLGGQIVCGERPALRERLMRRQSQRRHLERARCHRRLLPRLVAAQGKDVRKNRRRCDEVRCIARRSRMDRSRARAQQVQRHGESLRHQPRQQAARLRGLFDCGGCNRLTQHRLHQRWRGRDDLRTRHKQNQPRRIDPTAQVLHRQQRLALLVPLLQARLCKLRGGRNAWACCFGAGRIARGGQSGCCLPAGRRARFGVKAARQQSFAHVRRRDTWGSGP